jgi:hypothetical protein
VKFVVEIDFLPEAICQHTSREVSVGLKFVQLDLQFLWIAGFFESTLEFPVGINLPGVLLLHVFLPGPIEPIKKKEDIARLLDPRPSLWSSGGFLSLSLVAIAWDLLAPRSGGSIAMLGSAQLPSGDWHHRPAEIGTALRSLSSLSTDRFCPPTCACFLTMQDHACTGSFFPHLEIIVYPLS